MRHQQFVQFGVFIHDELIRRQFRRFLFNDLIDWFFGLFRHLKLLVQFFIRFILQCLFLIGKFFLFRRGRDWILRLHKRLAHGRPERFPPHRPFDPHQAEVVLQL